VINDETKRKKMFAKALLDRELQSQGIDPIDPQFEQAIGVSNSGSNFQGPTDSSNIIDDTGGSESLRAAPPPAQETTGGSGSPVASSPNGQPEWEDWNSQQRAFPTMAPSFPVGS
jgi:hypothetical protein